MSDHSCHRLRRAPRNGTRGKIRTELIDASGRTGPSYGHAWNSVALTPFTIADGRAPEVALRVASVEAATAKGRPTVVRGPRRRKGADPGAHGCGGGAVGPSPATTGRPADFHAWKPPVRSVARCRPRACSEAAARLDA